MTIENLTIIIPFWNGHRTVGRLLNSLPQDINIIIVNDYGSEPPVMNDKRVRVLNLDKRGYFAGACNAGFAACDTDVLILNQDVWFKGMQWQADIEHARIDGYAVFGEGVFGHPAWPRGYIQGTFMYMSREALKAVGDFNTELYPLWGATAEWQVRACRKGFKALPIRSIPGMQHEERKRYGSAITQALNEEPEKKSVFIRTPPEVSVIVPCYNYGHYLGECLDSLMAQTFHSFEVIIVDDASTDNSLEIARGFQDDWKAIRVFAHTENHGTATTLNTGIKRAYGKYITILSADDMREPYCFEKHYKANLENPHSFTYGNLIFYSNGKRTIIKLQEYDYSKLRYRNHVPAGIMYPKQAWKDVGGYPDIMNDGREDWAFAVGLGRAGYCGVHIGNSGSIVRREGQNRSLRNSGQHRYFLDKIRAIYPDVYASKECDMPCCGRRRRTTVKTTRPVSVGEATANEPDESGSVLLEYVGASIGTETLWCPSGRRYKYGRTARRLRIWVHPEDLDFVESLGLFKRVNVAAIEKLKPQEVAVEKIVNQEPKEKEVEAVVFEDDGKAVVSDYSISPKDEIDATSAAFALADEYGIDIALITGTGKDGRILKSDVSDYLEQLA